MPAYSGISFTICRSKNTNNLVRDFYDSIQSHGVHFHSVYTRNSPLKLSLDEIINYNQEKLNLSLIQINKTPKKYMGIMLSGTPYDECRLGLNLRGDMIIFSLSATEEDVVQHGYEVLKNISLSVLNKVPIEEIHSSAEDREATIEVQKGRVLAVEYFGYFRGKTFLEKDYCKFTMLGDGYFVEYKTG